MFGMHVFAEVGDKRVQALKVLEEASELCEAAKVYAKRIGASDDEDRLYRSLMLSEYADVLQTLVNLADAFDITDAEILDACRECTRRNEERGRF